MELYKKIDITKTLEKSREENTHLQSRLLFQLYKILNSIENFKYDILDGNLIIWEKIVPTFSAYKEQIDMLIDLFNAQDIPLQCPHGRPAVIKITRKDIDKLFKRIL